MILDSSSVLTISQGAEYKTVCASLTPSQFIDAQTHNDSDDNDDDDSDSSEDPESKRHMVQTPVDSEADQVGVHWNKVKTR